jgi:hypothetical protein
VYHSDRMGPGNPVWPTSRGSKVAHVVLPTAGKVGYGRLMAGKKRSLPGLLCAGVGRRQRQQQAAACLDAVSEEHANPSAESQS